jgi:hypothetical protein
VIAAGPASAPGGMAIWVAPSSGLPSAIAIRPSVTGPLSVRRPTVTVVSADCARRPAPFVAAMEYFSTQSRVTRRPRSQAYVPFAGVLVTVVLLTAFVNLIDYLSTEAILYLFD